MFGMNREKFSPTPGDLLLAVVRSGFVRNRTTLTRFCDATRPPNRLSRQSAYKALIGEWTGPGADQVCLRLLAAAGVKRDEAVAAGVKFEERPSGRRRSQHRSRCELLEKAG